jgi:threonine dehydrogenase-like Zn-dependent dehydrogenase
MKAIVFKNNQLNLIKAYPEPKPEKGEALIKVIAAGICRTDLEIIRGYMGFSGVPGHEFVGRIESCRNQDLLGRRVVGEINCGCGDCLFCRQGISRHCPNRKVLGILNKDGVMAEYLTLPETNLHLLPDGLSDTEAIFVEPLAAAYEILEQVHIKPGHRVLLLGDGKLGLLIAQVIGTTGCELTVAGKHTDRLKPFKAKGIISCHINQLNDNFYDIVIDATGSPQGIELALSRTAPQGKVVLKSTTASPAGLNLNYIVINEIELIGSRCGPFPPAISALAAKKIQVMPLISHHYNLTQGLEAFRQAGKPGAQKVIIWMEK